MKRLFTKYYTWLGGIKEWCYLILLGIGLLLFLLVLLTTGTRYLRSDDEENLL